MGISLKVQAVALVTLLVFPLVSGAQTVTPADAKLFMGIWASDVDTPGGLISLELIVTEAAGRVAAEIGGGGTPMSTVTEITKKGSSLVMQYSADVGGADTPITLTVEPAGDKLSLSFDVGGQLLPATATRK